MTGDSRLCPKNVVDSIIRTVYYGIRPGDFIYGILSNDFMEAVSMSDYENFHNLHNIAAFLYSRLPARSCGFWGSREKLNAHLSKMSVNEKYKEEFQRDFEYLLHLNEEYNV